ncbi:hypothetical protein LTR86_006155 [Recurvomyces mirabilis]|nr:hypothetical protein LTR86_006155 [Recurvomyces mirabilis]
MSAALARYSPTALNTHGCNREESKAVDSVVPIAREVIAMTLSAIKIMHEPDPTTGIGRLKPADIHSLWQRYLGVPDQNDAALVQEVFEKIPLAWADIIWTCETDKHPGCYSDLGETAAYIPNTYPPVRNQVHLCPAFFLTAPQLHEFPYALNRTAEEATAL